MHLPFCPARCPYCDFSTEVFAQPRARELIAGLLSHLRLIAPLAQGRRLASVYLGGGTPSMWPAAALAGLLAAARREIGLEAGAEVSLEANPGTLGPAKLDALLEAGINRLSLGAQSFDDRMLGRLGRRHHADQTRRAVHLARRAGLGNLNLDLIYGLPGQDPAQAARDLEAALELEPEHLSLYELTLGPETPFGRRYQKGRPPLPSPEQMAAMESAAAERLARAGLLRYEVSNYARPGRQCRHNQSTWRGGDYLALGPGAHGHLAGRRWALVRDVQAYLHGLAQGRQELAFSEQLSPAQRALELIMLGLRTSEGVELESLRTLLGDDPREVFAPALRRVRELGWAELGPNRLRPTELGLAMADAAAGLFA